MKLNRRNLLLASSAVITVTFSAPTAQAQRYWDNNGNITGFGNAGGVWGNLGSGSTTGNSTQGWSANTTGVGTTQLSNTFTTLTSTALFFGNGTLGLAGGTIGISGSVSAGNMTFATNTGAITLGNATDVGNITFGVGAANSTISVANTTGNVNIASAIIGGNITKAGAGTLILSGTNSYAGTTNISAGTLQIGAGSTTGTLGSGAVTNAGTLVFNRTNTYSLAAGNLITGAGAVTLAGSGNVTVAVDNQFNTTGALIFGGTVGSTTASTLDLANFSSTFGSLQTRTNAAGNNTIAIGAGKTLTINGNVAIGINNGVSQTNNLTVSGSGGSWVVTNSASTATFQVGGGLTANSTLSIVDLSGLGTFIANMSNAASLFRLGDANTAGSGTADLKLAANSTITVGTLSVGGASGSGITKTLSLGTGNNTINANSILIGENAGQRSSGTINFQNANGNLTIRSLTGALSTANMTMVSTNNTGNNLHTGRLLLAGHTVDVSLNALVMARKTSGSGGGLADAEITFDTGTFTANTVNMAERSGGNTSPSTGNITIGGGTASLGVVTMSVNAATNAAAVTTNANLVISGGNVTATSIMMANANGNATRSNIANANINLTGTGLLTLGGNITRAATALGTENAIITLNGGSLDMAANAIGNGTAGISLLAQSGALSNLGELNGGGTLTKTTAGTLTLSGVNTYTGTTDIANGTLALSGSANILANTNAVNLSNAAGIFNISGISSSETIGSLAGVASSSVVLGDRNLTVGGSANTTFGGVISGNGTLTKSGASTLILSGSNTYSGNTTLSAGTLVVTGSIANSTVELNSATLDGTGTVGGVSVADLAANTITNGNGGSTALTLGSLTLGGNATFDIRTAGTAGVIVTGALTTTPGNGTALVNVTSAPLWVTGTTYDLISFGSFGGNLTDFTKGTIVGLGGRQSSALVLNGNNVSLSISGESVRWTGGNSTAWTTAVLDEPKNWITTGGNVTTDFLATDDVIFDNSATGAGNVIVDITDASVSPNSVIFNNTSARDYTINGNGSFGIASGSLSVTGGGNVTLNTVNTYTGLTTVSSGNLVLGSIGSLASGNALTLGAASTADFQNAGQTLGAVSNANTATNALNFSAGNGTVTLASLSGAGNTRFGSDGIVTGGIATGTVTSVGNLTADISGTATITAGGLLTGTISSGTVGADSLSSTAVSGGAVTVTNLATIGALSGSGTLGAGSLTATSVTGGTNTITGAAGITTLNGGNTTVGGVATITTMTSGTANLNGATSAITTLNGGAINLGTTALTVSGGSTSGTITGANGSLIKDAAGTLTLSGNNSYGGGTFITGAGSIVSVTTDSNALGSGNVTLNGGRRLTIAGGLNVANDIIIANTGGESGRGMLETSGNATYSGDITINSIAGAGGHFYAAGGEMTLSGVITSSVVVSQRNGTVIYSGGGTGYGNLSITGIGRVGALDGMSANATVEIGTTGGAGTLDLNGFDQSLVGIIKGAGTATIGTSSTTANSTLTLTGTSSYAGTIVDVIPLSGGNKTVALTVASGGNLTLSAANTYTGATTISGGTLQIGAGSTTGAIDSTSGVINNGALVYSRSDAHAAAYAISGTGTVAKFGNGTLTLSGNNTYGGNTTIDGTGAGNNIVLTVSSNTALGNTTGGTTLIGSVSGSNSGASINLSNGVTVTDETLTVNVGVAGTRAALVTSGNATWAGNVVIASNAGFGTFQSTGTGMLTIGANSTNTVTLDGPWAVRGSGNTTINSTISGIGSLSKTDDGTLFLTAANTHTGNTDFNGGIGKIRLVDSLALGNSTVSFTRVTNTTSLLFDSSVVANAFTIGGLSATANGTSKNIALQNTDNVAIALTVGSNNANTTYNGVLSAGGSLIKTGTGTLTLGGNSTYTGTTTVSDGILSLGSSLAIQNSALDTAGSITGNSTAGLRTTATTLTMGGLTGNKNLADVFETATGGYGNVTALTLNPGANVTHSYSGGIADGATGMTLTKSGLGTQILSGNNTYTGATNVDNGTLRINGSVSTSLVTVNSGGTLGGNGSIGGSVNVTSGGTFAAGSSIESIVVGGDFTTANGTFAYELDKSVLPGVAGDLTTVGGNLTLSLAVTNTLTLTELGIGGAWELGTPLGDPFGSPAADKLTLIAYFGTWNGGLFTYNGNLVQDDSAIIINSQQWWFNYNDTTAGTNYMGDLGLSTSFVTITVPEPNVAALLGGLGTLALLRRRRN